VLAKLKRRKSKTIDSFFSEYHQICSTHHFQTANVSLKDRALLGLERNVWNPLRGMYTQMSYFIECETAQESKHNLYGTVKTTDTSKS